MYTNQTAEELEGMRCTSDGIFKAQNSILLKINCGLVYFLVLVTFFMSFKSMKILKYHNLYSHGSQILLMSILLNANLNQAVFLEIKIRQLIHVLTYAKDPCKIEFHTHDCTYDQSIYAFTNILSTSLGSAITCDRFIAFYASSLYYNHSKLISYLLLSLSISFTLFIHIHTYGGVSRAGYVPSCQYPPQLSLDNFESINKVNFWFILANCVLTIVILLLNIRKDKQIKKSIFETKLRYNSFENKLTTKAICIITSTQFAFLSFSTAAVTIISSLEAGMSEDGFHLMAQYLTGNLYGNVSIPILIYFITKQCIEQRRKSIDRLTNHTMHVDFHISSLKAAWETT